VSGAYFPISREGIDWLCERDPQLGDAIRGMDPPKRVLLPDLFSGLVFYVISQQISAKAAATEWGRLQELFGPVTPQRMAGLTPEEIQMCGTTLRRSGYIHDIARQVAFGRMDLRGLADLPDDEFCRRVTRLPGVGMWTAQMLLVHVLCRPDVISYGDIAIRRGMRMVYGLPEVSREEFDRRRRLYSPYATTASIYLWAISTGKANEGDGASTC
jgi:DNA-3-methyladenine glycosylase II